MARRNQHRSQSHDMKRVAVDKGLQELLFKDAVQYCIFVTNQAYLRLQADLLSLSKWLDNSGTADDQFYGTQISAMMHAWQVVDSVHRLRTLLNKGPRLMRIPTKDTECLRFMRQTEVVEQLRHTIQHLDRDIFDFVNLRLPAFGSLNWLAKLHDSPGCDTHTLVPGTIFDRTQPFINPANVRGFAGPIGVVTLISTAQTNLTDIVQVELPRLAEWLKKSAGIDCSNRGQGLLICAHWAPNAEASKPEA